MRPFAAALFVALSACGGTDDGSFGTPDSLVCVSGHDEYHDETSSVYFVCDEYAPLQEGEKP